jgi:hypothetical protein
MAIVDGKGTLRLTEASNDLIVAGMTALDAKTIETC